MFISVNTERNRASPHNFNKLFVCKYLDYNKQDYFETKLPTKYVNVLTSVKRFDNIPTKIKYVTQESHPQYYKIQVSGGYKHCLRCGACNKFIGYGFGERKYSQLIHRNECINKKYEVCHFNTKELVEEISQLHYNSSSIARPMFKVETKKNE